MKSIFEELLNNEISMKDVVSKLLELHGIEKACEPIIQFANTHDDKILVDDLVTVFNEAICNGDFAIYRCKHCGQYETWAGSMNGLIMWSCEDCNDTFCSLCVPVSDDKHILCLDCQ